MKVAARPSPAAALRDRVEAMHAESGLPIALATDAESYADRVLVAVRLPASAFVMTIARSEYDGMAILKILGFQENPVSASRPDAMTRARALKGRP